MPEVARVRILWDIGVVDGLVGTKFDIEYSNTSTAGLVPATTMDAVWDWWMSGVQSQAPAKDSFGDVVSLSKVTHQRLTPTLGAVVDDDRVDVDGTRGAGGLQMPPQAAILLSYRTATSSRRQRGRSFFPAPIESDVANDGSLGTAYMASLGPVLLSLFQEVESTGRIILPNTTQNHVVVSRATGSPLAFGVTSYRLGAYLRTQRRRAVDAQSYVTL